MEKKILTTGLMVGGQPVPTEGKPKEKGKEITPGKHNYTLYIALMAMLMLVIIGAVFFTGISAQISVADQPPLDPKQPVPGPTITPPPTQKGQEKECALYNMKGQCLKYTDGTKGVITQNTPVTTITPHVGKNRLKSVWSKDEIDGTNIKNSPDPEIIFGRLPEIYNDGAVAIKGSIIDGGTGVQGVMVKNIGTVPVTVIVKVRLLDLTLQQQDAYPNGIEYVSGKATLKPGRTFSTDVLRPGIKKFEISVQYT